MFRCYEHIPSLRRVPDIVLLASSAESSHPHWVVFSPLIVWVRGTTGSKTGMSTSMRQSSEACVRTHHAGLSPSLAGDRESGRARQAGWGRSEAPAFCGQVLSRLPCLLPTRSSCPICFPPPPTGALDPGLTFQLTMHFNLLNCS